MTRFENEYLPLARAVIDAQEAIASADERTISVFEAEDCPEAEARRRAYDNYLGSIAYSNAYRAFMTDEGGPEQTHGAIDAMNAELDDLEAILRGEE